MLDSRRASDAMLMVPETIALHLCMGESRTSVKLCVLNELNMTFSLDTTYIDKFSSQYTRPKNNLSSPLPANVDNNAIPGAALSHKY